MLVKEFKNMVYKKMDNGTHLIVFIPNYEYLNLYIGRLGIDNNQKEPFAFGFENSKEKQVNEKLEISFAFQHSENISMFIEAIIYYLNSIIEFDLERSEINHGIHKNLHEDFV